MKNRQLPTVIPRTSVSQFLPVQSNEYMKRLIPFAAIFVIGLLATQPVLSSLYCAARLASSCAPGCPMTLSGMPPDCQMTGMTAAPGCTQSCCSRNTVEAMLPQTSASRFKAVASPATVALPVSAATAPGPARLALVSFDIRSSSPPRYIVNRAFRI
jgi:hypothetical protein